VNTEQGVLEQAGERWRLRYERHLNHPPAKVWRALTDPTEVLAWFPTAVIGDRAVGAKLTFPFPDQDLPAMDGEMLRYEPPTLLEFTWAGDTLRFELTPTGPGTTTGTNTGTTTGSTDTDTGTADTGTGTRTATGSTAAGGCRLTLTVDFDELGKAARDGAGWHECLDLLRAALAGEPTWPPGQRHADIAPAYVTAFGPAASALGPPDGWKLPTDPR
jgi:uncharacterized protein YndB with AHSA1/START domain